jgi:hypothetical protein
MMRAFAMRAAAAVPLVPHHRNEAGARRRLTELAAPAVVHGGDQRELVDIELDQVGGDALHRRRREERRIGVPPLQAVVDVG